MFHSHFSVQCTLQLSLPSPSQRCFVYRATRPPRCECTRATIFCLNKYIFFWMRTSIKLNAPLTLGAAFPSHVSHTHHPTCASKCILWTGGLQRCSHLSGKTYHRRHWAHDGDTADWPSGYKHIIVSFARKYSPQRTFWNLSTHAANIPH